MSFNKRVWLNPPGHSSTGSVVCFSGEAQWGYGDEPVWTRFLEIADCQCKIRLHQSKFDTKEQYREKIELLRDTLNEFILALEEE